MIHGVGIDIVRTERIRDAVEKWGNRFLDRIFTPAEISYCRAKRDPHISLAVRFAAKEAFIKAAGSGTPSSLKDIEVVNLSGGRPVIRASGAIAEFLSEQGIGVGHLSLSHEREYGVACVVLERLP